MQAQHRSFFHIIRGNGTQFVIPVFQRDYRWTEENCRKLWDDIVLVGGGINNSEHFVGSVVYIATGDTSAGFTRWLLIDGQQRVTTLTLLLTALRDHIEDAGWSGSEDGPTAKKIDAYFLQNTEEEGARKLKLRLRRHDDETLHALVTRSKLPDNTSNRVAENYDLFRDLLRDANPEVVYRGINRLVLVDVTLERGKDDPQLIFESLNATGVDLSSSDLIRNFILMSLEEREQTRLYSEYWNKIDSIFRGNDRVFENFIRDYLALLLRPAKLERSDRIYAAFKRTFQEKIHDAAKLENLLGDILRRAKQYAAFTLGTGNDNLSRAFSNLRYLGDAPAILIMCLLEAYEKHQTLTEDDLHNAVRLLESYMLRRAVIGSQTKGYSLEFAKAAYKIDPEKPLASLKASLARMPAAYAFPENDDFVRALTESDIYHKRVCFHLLDGLENRDRKEQSDTTGYSIEHIMPQNERLSDAWKAMLGEAWKEVQSTWLHRLGNLTLTGYNSTYSDRPLVEKQSIENGFKQSSVRLNLDVRDAVTWTPKEMAERGYRLAKHAVATWPALDADTKMIREALRAELKILAERGSIQNVKMSVDARAIFTALRSKILHIFPDVIEMAEAKSVSYHDPDCFVELIPRAHGLGVLIGIEYNEVDEPNELIEDASNYSFVVNAKYPGGVLMTLRDVDQVDHAMRIITQARTLLGGD